VAAYRALAARGPVVIVGDSTGGSLALAATFSMREPPPAVLVLFSPWVDLHATRPNAFSGEAVLTAQWLEACARHYCGNRDVVSPLDADLSGLPPTLIQAGTDELLHDDAIHLHDALERAGVEVRCEIVPGGWHSFQLFADWLPSADAALARAADFIATHLSAACGQSQSQ
jgi:acetyl esterase/lipase